ncbi:MAG TPA: pyridoxamine 5'-phosphate oxidase family protein [Tepidisphaeraceae bacterium]|nr:pyridoxamine 5'-phosphate oxidase family protein [Tepidisphaeraceae bacterium]
MSIAMMEWLSELRTAMDREFGDRSRVMILATVDRSGGPQARCVVCRRVTEDGRLFFASDSRTKKNDQVRGEKRAAIVCWMPAIRVQFRINGDVKIVGYPEDESLRKEIWQGLTDESRSLSFWPTPGIAAASDDAFARAVGSDVPPPQNFEILIMEPKQVIRLALDSHPHRRRLWRAEANWAGVDVNP